MTINNNHLTAFNIWILNYCLFYWASIKVYIWSATVLLFRIQQNTYLHSTWHEHHNTCCNICTDNMCKSLDIPDNHTRWHNLIFTDYSHSSHVCTAAETHMQILRYGSSPISVTLKVKPQLEDVIVKLTAKASLVWIFPLTVDNLESNILHKTQQNSWTCTIQCIMRSHMLYINWRCALLVMS